jgi:hypothetical protein
MKKEIDTTGYILIISLFIMLIIAAYLSFKSIDYKILEKLEAVPLNLPTPANPNPIIQETVEDNNN